MTESAKPPTVPQLRYLAALARRRGVSFARPATSAAASRQIAALKAMPAASSERALERDLGAAVEVPPGALAAVEEYEIEGYGSQARWRRPDLGRA